MIRPVAVRAAFAAVAIAGSAAAVAQLPDLPARKPGLWEIRMTTEQPAGTPVITSQMCIDAATDREMHEFGLKMSKDTCKKFDSRRTAAAWIIDAECSFGPMKSLTKTTITGDFQKTVSVRIEGTTDGMPGAGSGPQKTLMTQVATWKGPCGDLKPGDITMGRGIKMNVKQLQKLKDMLPNIRIK
jgi:hypothetical protein